MDIKLSENDVAYLARLLGYAPDRTLTQKNVVDALARTPSTTAHAVAYLFASKITNW